MLGLGIDGSKGFLEQLLGAVHLLAPKFWVREKSREMGVLVLDLKSLYRVQVTESSQGICEGD